MLHGREGFRNVILSTVLAMGVLVAGGYMLRVPLWLLVGGAIFTVASLATAVLAQRPNVPSAAIDSRRFVGLFIIVPLLIGVSVLVSLMLGLSFRASLVLAGVTFLSGNYVFFRWFDAIRHRGQGDHREAQSGTRT